MITYFVKESYFKTKDNKRKGFTLIELVAVIAIISVLAAAFIPKISGYIDEAKKVSVLNEAKSVITAYESIAFNSSSLGENPKISAVISNSGSILTEADITKIDTEFTVEDCRNLLNTENFTFTIEDGKATTPIEK